VYGIAAQGKGNVSTDSTATLSLWDSYTDYPFGVPCYFMLIEVQKVELIIVQCMFELNYRLFC
jgi:hypothetical protein